ncbi:MAG: archaellin/type IV pilin N-terminal domain-containing protein [Dehalococcoidia bacterium]
MIKRLLGRIFREEKGITGLETAIILIAFVVVAAVFAYTVLSAGLFSSQKGQEAVYAGLEETRSTMEMKGSVVATGVSAINDNDAPLGWISSDTSNTVISRNTTAATVKEGNASMLVAASVTNSQNDYVYHPMPATDIATADSLSFWVYCDDSDCDTSGDLVFWAHTTSTITSGQSFSVGGITASTWTRINGSLGSPVTGALFFGLEYTQTEATNIYIDNVTMTVGGVGYGGVEYLLSDADYPVGYVSSDTSNTPATRNTTSASVREGTASLLITTDASGNSTGDYVYHALASRAFTTSDTISFWIYSGTALASGDVVFDLDSDSNISDSTAFISVGVVTAATWLYVSGTPAAGVTATFYGWEYTGDAVETIYLDMLQGPVPASSRTKMPTSYADSLTLTVVNALGGEAINFTPTVDTDADGIISDESTKNHYLTVSLIDEYQNVTDLAWTMTALVGDGDDLLESNETFQITIDLKAVNLGAGTITKNSKKLGPRHIFTMEIKPEKGATLSIQRRLPGVVTLVNDLQ